MNLRKILLTTDFSDCSRGAFRPAASIARRNGAHIDLVMVGGVLSPLTHGPAAVGHSLEKYHEDLARDLAELASDEVFEGVSIRPHVLGGFGAEAIDEYLEEHEHDLLVTATHGHSGLKRLLMGSFAERLVQLSPCPVLTVRGDSLGVEFAPKRILVPHDFSDPSSAPIPYVKDLAERFNAEILLVHVLDVDLLPVSAAPSGSGGTNEYPVYWEEARVAANKRLSELADRELEGISTQFSVLHGAVVPELVEKSKSAEADLIVMSTHGRTGLTHALLGSVAERIVRGAPCSVLTVRPR